MMQTIIPVYVTSMHKVISFKCFGFCRTYMASKGRIRAGCFATLGLVENLTTKSLKTKGSLADTIQCNILT